MAFRSLSSNLLLIFHLCDHVTSWRHVMTSQNLIYLSQLVDVLERWFFFCFHGFHVTEFRYLNKFLILFMLLRHDVMSWRHVNTYHHPSSLTDLVVEPYWDYYTISMLIWVVGINQIIDTNFACYRQHVTTPRHDVHDVTSCYRMKLKQYQYAFTFHMLIDQFHIHIAQL